MFARFCQEYRVTDRPLRVIQGMFGHGFLQIPKSLAESPLPALDVILRIEADRFTVLLRDRDQLRILFLQRLKYRLYRAPHSVAVRVVMGRNVNVRLVRPQALKRSTRCERIETSAATAARATSTRPTRWHFCENNRDLPILERYWRGQEQDWSSKSGKK